MSGTREAPFFLHCFDMTLCWQSPLVVPHMGFVWAVLIFLPILNILKKNYAIKNNLYVFTRPSLKMELDYIYLSIYEGVSDVAEISLQFASNILTLVGSTKTVSRKLKLTAAA